MKFRIIGSLILVAIFGVAFMQQTENSQETSVQSTPVQGNDAFTTLKID